jgi:multidrug resistance efflux pump
MTTTTPVEEHGGPAPPPARPTRRSVLRRIRTAVVVLILLAVAAGGGTYLVRQRLAAQAFVSLGDAVLTAEAVPVGSADAGVVTELLVAEQTRVTAGQDLAKVRLTANGTGPPQTQVLRAPIAGTVSAVNVAVGSVARAGEPVVTLYDQDKLTFQAKVPVDRLRQLRLGMTAFVSGPGLERRISVNLDHVVPQVGNGTLANADQLTVVLVPVPADVGRVRTLVPGLQFTAIVDTKTAFGATPAVNRAG